MASKLPIGPIGERGPSLNDLKLPYCSRGVPRPTRLVTSARLPFWRRFAPELYPWRLSLFRWWEFDLMQKADVNAHQRNLQLRHHFENIIWAWFFFPVAKVLM